MPSRLRLLEDWNSYRRAVLPPDCSDIQLQETRRAFYAGARALFSRLFGDMTAGPDPQEADLAMMSDIDQELRSFLSKVKAGEA